MKKQIFAAFLALFLMVMLPGTARAAGDEAGLSDSRTRSAIFTIQIQTKPLIRPEEPTEPEDPEDPADVNQTEILPEDDSSEDEKQKEKDEDDDDEDEDDEDKKEESNPEENNQSTADEGSGSGTSTPTIGPGKPIHTMHTSPPQTLRDQTTIDDDSVNHTISGEITPENRLARPEQNSYTVEIARPKENKPAAPGKLSGATVIQPPAAPAFMDVRQDDWFFEDVKWACEEGFMTGMSDNSFAPMDDVSQAVIVVVLSRMAGADLSRFHDLPDSTVAANKWYTGAAIWAKQSGLLPADSVFTGSAAVSREEMAVILSKYLQNMGKDTTVPARIIEFADAEDMSQAGNDAFQVLCACNVFSGTGGGRMNPAGSMTRAQFAALVHRIADIP